MTPLLWQAVADAAWRRLPPKPDPREFDHACLLALLEVCADHGAIPRKEQPAWRNVVGI